MQRHSLDDILWEAVLDPIVANLESQKPFYNALKKGFEHLAPEEIDDIERRLTEFEIALATACYNAGLAQGVGIKEQLAPVAG